MPRHMRRPFWLTVPALLFAIFTWKWVAPEPAKADTPAPSSGSLWIMGNGGSIKGECPLKHTAVRGAISGFVARVTVTQIFENTASDKIEAVYAFPLPEDSAVDDMTIQIGERTVRGVIKKREEARAIYEDAKNTGHVAALLDQERPNVFTQAVANIMPGEQVTVTIRYLHAGLRGWSLRVRVSHGGGPALCTGQSDGQAEWRMVAGHDCGSGWVADNTSDGGAWNACGA